MQFVFWDGKPHAKLWSLMPTVSVPLISFLLCFFFNLPFVMSQRGEDRKYGADLLWELMLDDSGASNATASLVADALSSLLQRDGVLEHYAEDVRWV